MLCSTLYLRAIFQVQAPGGLTFGGAIQRRVFLRYRFGGLIFEGAYTWRGLIFGILRYIERKGSTEIELLNRDRMARDVFPTKVQHYASLLLTFFC